jgi:endonuclease YncB( thermonuclease family)
MAIRAKNPTWSSVLLMVVVAAVWGWERWHQPPGEPRAKPTARSQAATGVDASGREGGYERFDGCAWVDDRLNDGDSFKLRLPGGREETFRLYFVDTPESKFKRYAGGDSNHARIDDQAAYFDGISAQQAVEVGQSAKHFVKAQLSAKPFTLYTRWEDPFGDRRFHAFVRFADGGSPAWLDERLVEKGLCRIFTKGANLPDGTPIAKHKARLKELEREAKNRRAGAWAK